MLAATVEASHDRFPICERLSVMSSTDHVLDPSDLSDTHGAERGVATWTSRQRLVLVLLLTASFTLAIDFSILNVALPVIGSEVGFRLENLQWIATSFALCAAGFTLFFGRVADLVGRKRLFLIGMAALGVGSLVGGIAQDPGVLLGARVVQGLATAAVTPAALSLLTTSFPEGPQRERALGLNGSLMAAGFTTGAILGGLLTDLLSWRWAFFLNIPVVIFVLVLGPRLLTEGVRERGTRLDVPGAVSVTGSLLLLVFGMTRIGEHGTSDAAAWWSLAAGGALFLVFLLVERAAGSPLVPLAILRRSTVLWGNLAGILAFATETSLVFLLTLYLQEVQGFSPLGAGLSFAVLGVGTVLGGLLAPRVIGASSPKAAIVGGLLVQAAATATLLLLGTSTGSVWLLLAATFIGGIANLVAIVGFMVSATSGLPDTEQGLATGLANMSTQVGITIGIPIMATVLAGVLVDDSAGALLDALRTAIGVNVALAVVAALGVVVLLRRPRPA